MVSALSVLILIIMEKLMRFGILVLIVRLCNDLLCPGHRWRTGNLSLGSHVFLPHGIDLHLLLFMLHCSHSTMTRAL
jgi:hypothetical protein